MILGKYYKIYGSHGYPMMFPKNSYPPGIRLLDRQDQDLEETAKLPGEADSGMHRHELMRLAGSLSPDQRDIIVMMYFRGHTMREVSRLLNVPLGTIKSRQRSALYSLRKIYGSVFGK
jgi:RNA polymerase sigma-70 factor (ECF subfamily)